MNAAWYCCAFGEPPEPVTFTAVTVPSFAVRVT